MACYCCLGLFSLGEMWCKLLLEFVSIFPRLRVLTGIVERDWVVSGDFGGAAIKTFNNWPEFT